MQNKFQERMYQLFKESGLSSYQKFADEIGLSRQCVVTYLNTNGKLPDGQSLMKICSKLNVSADWLLGRSDVKNTSTNIQTACKTLRLSETAALAILQCNNLYSLDHDADIPTGIISNLFEMRIDNLDNFAKSLLHYFEAIQKINIPHDIMEEISFELDHDGSVILSGYAAADYFAQQLSDRFYELVRDHLYQAEANRRKDVDNG